MTYQRFEDLPVWQEAAKLYEATEVLLARRGIGITPGFRDQLDRAALSVSNNIAEGFERGTTNELLMFIYIARGSAGEVRSMLCMIERRLERAANQVPEIRDAKSNVAAAKQMAEACSRQLRGWADSLQNSDIRGVRHLTDKIRREKARDKHWDEYRKAILSKLPPDHVLRRNAEEQDTI